MNHAGQAVHVRLKEENGRVLYAGEAIYRPRKPHPLSNEPWPQLGILDDAMPERPQGDGHYRRAFPDEEVAATGVYLERVVTCWWFLLERVRSAEC
ncbi:MAG: hypothetical protein ACR2PL_08040 [Dehalococcoidia bacterium]